MVDKKRLIRTIKVTSSQVVVASLFWGLISSFVWLCINSYLKTAIVIYLVVLPIFILGYINYHD